MKLETKWSLKLSGQKQFHEKLAWRTSLFLLKKKGCFQGDSALHNIFCLCQSYFLIEFIKFLSTTKYPSSSSSGNFVDGKSRET